MNRVKQTDDDKIRLPRRSFLLLIALGTSTILLAACQVTQATHTPALSTTPTPTATSTVTRTPTITPSPTSTQTATVTPTPTPIVRAEPWEPGREDQDKTLAQLMFPFIGGINHINRHGIDLRYGDLNIAFVGESQVDLSQNLQALRESYAEQLNQDPQLLKQLASIRAQLEGTDNVIVVIENGRITQVVDDSGSLLERFHVDSEGVLTPFSPEEEPQLLPALYVDGPYIKRTDTGEIIVFKGSALNLHETEHQDIFLFTTTQLEKNFEIRYFSNVIRLSFDTTDITENNLEKIYKIAQYCEERGIYIMFTPHHVNEIMLPLPDKNVEDSLDLLSQRLNKRSNIIYGLWNEPQSSYEGVNWSIWTNQIKKLVEIIYNNHGSNRGKPIIAISGTKWSRDFRGMPDDFAFPFIIDVHDYPWNDGITITNVRDWWTNKIGFAPIIISEMGNVDPFGPQSDEDIAYIKDTLLIIQQNSDKIGYTIWKTDTSEGALRTKSGKVTPRGKILIEEQKNNPSQTDFTK